MIGSLKKKGKFCDPRQPLPQAVPDAGGRRPKAEPKELGSGGRSEPPSGVRGGASKADAFSCNVELTEPASVHLGKSTSQIIQAEKSVFTRHAKEK